MILIFHSIIISIDIFIKGDGTDRTTSCQNQQEEWWEEEDAASQG